MHTLVVGLNYETAPVEIREKLSFIESDIPNAMEALQNQKKIKNKNNKAKKREFKPQ